MSGPQFNRPGAVDLSGLKAPSAAAKAGSGAFVIEITGEASLTTEVVNKSMSVVVLLNVWSSESAESVELNTNLAILADEFGGRFVLATLDAKAHASLVSALGIPSVPLVAAALRGQLAPLLQESRPLDELRAVIQQILQAAAANGITGTAEPAARTGATADAEPVSRFPEAEDALMQGDLDGAIAHYTKALNASPGDAEAAEGLARAELMKRTADADPSAARAAAAEKPDDVEAQTLVADLDLMGGHVDDAFSRLLDLVRRLSGPERDEARRHLVELFAVVGDADPRVGKARRALTAALF